jgi:secreted trypsin-like serine protease
MISRNEFCLLLASTLLLTSACSRQPEAFQENPITSSWEQLSSESSGIVGGIEVSTADAIASSTVALYNPQSGSLCTASLIGRNLAITAAHCADFQVENSVLIFDRKLPVADSKTDPVYRRVTKAKIHPQYQQAKTEKNHGDIALIRFSGDLPAGYQPIKVLREKSFLKNGMEVTIAGYGMLSMEPAMESSNLMKASIELSDVNFSESEVLFHQFEGRGACHGDSGGPAFVTINGVNVLFAVTSRAATEKGGSTCLEGSIYTSVSFYLPWLRTVAAEIMRD